MQYFTHKFTHRRKEPLLLFKFTSTSFNQFEAVFFNAPYFHFCQSPDSKLNPSALAATNQFKAVLDKSNLATISSDSPCAKVYSLCHICRSRLWLSECRYFLLRPARFETKRWFSFHLNPPSLIGKLNPVPPPNLFTQSINWSQPTISGLN